MSGPVCPEHPVCPRRPGRRQADSEIFAAGALLYTLGPGGLEVAVIHRPGRDDWTFPKGKLEPGEHVLAGAVREVTEETGIRPVLGPPLATVRYQVEGRPKRVDYWAARVDAPAGPFVPNSEVATLEWLPAAQAASRLSYPHDAAMLEHLESVAAWGSVPCILLRHAPAGRKSAWPGDDLLRPLDPSGAADAEVLADLLGCYAPRRVVSSAAERCLGTVRPYAERIGASIEAVPEFATGPGVAGDRAEAARRCMTELISRPDPMVVCAHRENLPVLLDQALAVLDSDLPADNWAPPKSGFWVLHVASGRLAALEHHDLES
ncbi:MAG: NUDIX hydrolase [Streptosporangiaceae bacterium]